MTAIEAGQRGSGAASTMAAGSQGKKPGSFLKVVTVLFAVTAPLPRCPAAHAQTSLTIYNDGRVLMRRTLPVAVPRGSSVQRLTLGALDPATVFSLDSSVTLMGVSYDGAVDEGSALRRSVGKRLVFRLPPGPAGSPDTISALVLGVDPLRLQLPDGRISFTQPGIPLYPPDVVVAEPTANLSVRSAQGLDKLRLGYFTGGASWQASYQVVLSRADARVTGMAVLASQSLRAEDAEVHLLAGEVGQAQQKRPPQPLMREMRMEVAQAVAADQFAGEQRVGEFHLYSLGGRTTLLPGLTTSVALFQPAQVKYERNYIVHWGRAVLGIPAAAGRGDPAAGGGRVHTHAAAKDGLR